MDKVSKRPAPAYMEYASDVLANANYRMMSLAERGLLDTMRKECWVNGRIPAGSENISAYLKFDSIEIQKLLSKRVLSFFSQIDDYLVCPELDGYRANLEEKNRKIAEGGKKGGLKTQSKHKSNQATLEASVKPLRRYEEKGNELSREEMKRLDQYAPSIEIDFNSSSSEINEWVRQQQKYMAEKEIIDPSTTKISNM